MGFSYVYTFYKIKWNKEKDIISVVAGQIPWKSWANIWTSLPLQILFSWRHVFFPEV